MFDRNRWLISEQENSLVESLSEALSLYPICAKLLINRGYKTVERARAFMGKSDTFLYNPYLLKDIQKAVERIKRALAQDEKITIYGDYDVDGVTSVSILYMYLKDHGAKVNYYIPTRDGEGYGLNTNAFNMIRENGTKLIITVDTGITATKEVEYAKSIGLDVIVTDHHECRPELPICEAVINPKRPDCQYPFKELSGVGVTFKLLCALELDFVNCGEYNLFTIKDMCRRYIDLVTIGTIADVMPLYDENRIMVYMGLSILSSTHNIGVRAMFRAVGTNFTKKITSSMIGYTVAPRINAAGRIGNASRAVDLFLSTSPRVADVIAEELCNTNRERQQTENLIFTEAIAQIERDHDLSRENVLVLDSDHWHQGVIGIVASKITEQFGKPSILISFEKSEDEEEMIGKGSARSVKGLNMVEALASCEELLIKYGGHELAAGLSLKKKNLLAFRETLNRYAAETFSSSEFVSKTAVEAEITEEDVSIETCMELAKLEPYGAGNPEPIFALRDVEILELATLSLGKHTRMILRKNEKEMAAVIFGYNLINKGYVVGDRVDVLCMININEFRGQQNVQLIVKDIDLSEWSWNEMKKEAVTFEEIQKGTVNCPEEIIPSRSDFVEIYSFLRKSGHSHTKQLTMIKLLSLFPDMNYIKIRIILEVLKESELIAFSQDGIANFTVTCRETNDKKNLEESPLMKTIKRACI